MKKSEQRGDDLLVGDLVAISWISRIGDGDTWVPALFLGFENDQEKDLGKEILIFLDEIGLVAVSRAVIFRLISSFKDAKG